MNISSFIGIGLACSTLWFGVFKAAPDKTLFLDQHAIILVLGGTLSAAMLAFPLERFGNLLRFAFHGFLFKKVLKQAPIYHELQAIALLYHQDPKIPPHSEMHPFLSEALIMLGNSNINGREMRELLMRRIDTMKSHYKADAKMLNALGKFPPAFGLLGASAGMIAMMMNLGKGGTEAIGPSMAIALVATFWGIAVANLVLLPLADFASKMAQEEVDVRLMIVDATVLLKEGRSPSYVQEYLRGLVTPSIRDYLPLSKKVASPKTQTEMSPGKSPQAHLPQPPPRARNAPSMNGKNDGQGAA